MIVHLCKACIHHARAYKAMVNMIARNVALENIELKVEYNSKYTIAEYRTTAPKMKILNQKSRIDSTVFVSYPIC